MYTLRLTPISESDDRFRVEISLGNSHGLRLIATSHFHFQITAHEQEDLRWYLEEFLQYPLDPAPKIAARVEQHMIEIGEELFQSVFQSSEDVRKLWASILPHLSDTHVEVMMTDANEAAYIPWELMRDPVSKKPLALSSRTFIRAQSRPSQSPNLPQFDSDTARILLVICRPGGEDDVPFRSVAMRILRSLEESAHEGFQLDVLRPPTFARLSSVLHRARDEGRPYHIVHFDGHGIYEDLLATTSGTLPQSKRGYLLFENSAYQDNCEPVHGEMLGKTLSEGGARVLVMNACRSAHAAPFPSPSEHTADIDARVRAFGSLAQEVVNIGVAAVVAMRYNIYVVTAAQFVADLYAGLAQGQTFGEAVTLSRRRLSDQPLREIAYISRPLQDWLVPVAYGDIPSALFPHRETLLDINSEAEQPSVPGAVLDEQIPNRPDAGFFGRDETLLTLDRLFDTNSVVLLHAYAGSGKTSTAVEFARWYVRTGGIDGPMLFTSFGRYRPLARVLDQIGQVFDETLRQSGVNWLNLTSDEERRCEALKVLGQTSVLWVWDNVEPVAGFPAGAVSEWSMNEQRELVNFLNEAGMAGAKFLLTSRSDEQDWLGDLPSRTILPPMPMQDRVQLASALAKHYGKQFTDVADWLPLLKFTQGNPLSITVLVGYALRKGLCTKVQIEEMVTQLSIGETIFEDDESEGRTKSLGASLHYGFEHAFKENERRQLALLHLFQGIVHVDVLWAMGDPSNTKYLAELNGLSLESGLKLIERAAEIGLLTPLGGGCYSIHPAIPWFLKRLFEQYYPVPAGTEGEHGIRAAQSFAFATAAIGEMYSVRIDEGNAAATRYLNLQEDNLLRALQIAQRYKLSDVASLASNPLYKLYRHYNRLVEWERMADRLTLMSTDPQTGLSLPGWEELWVHASEYQVLLAKEKRLLVKAEKLQRQRLDWLQRAAKPVLAIAPGEINDKQRRDIQYLAIALHTMAQIKREQDSPECIGLYEQAISMAERIGDNYIVAMCAFNLGNAYSSLQSLTDLARAEQWYQRSLKLQPKSDTRSIGRGHGELGNIALKRLIEPGEKDMAKSLQFYKDAVDNYLKALELLPPDDVSNRAVAYNGLGVLRSISGDTEGALRYFWEATQLLDAAGQHFVAGQFRSNIAATLFMADRVGDALEYAQSALRDFQRAGENAEHEILVTLEFIRTIEQSIHAGGHQADG